MWEKFEKIKALRSLWLDVVKLPIVGINLENDILRITLSHPAHLQEWRMKEEVFLEELRREYKKRGLKKVAVFKKIVCKVNGGVETKKEEKEEDLSYEERARGEFVNHCTNERLAGMFEKIREIIRSRNDRETKAIS
ncbi:hypothetical protein BBW65_07095 [Helicobacter enhydrae]|uniref:DUF721 domain-containing protein n=1 Tax=Helicobacter enhydrae TaxID=222136 RepID=A0A1B1U6Z8_9HELI|nr:hypothetical protein [Helicobacter enhydrae]ANV98304.1 hypothetical protein BBW65_05600 [Helicobacter enhydrae]ANV98574.1 hypothetical protein BBW65_07095 [Helicobacter enhydrae]